MYTKEDKNSTAPVKPVIPGNEYRDPQRSNRAFAGVLVVAVGSVLLARQLDVDLPDWLFNIGTLIVVVGFYIGFRTNFKNWAWLIVAGIGAAVIAGKVVGFSVGLLPMVIIGVGLFMIFRPKRERTAWRDWGQNFEDTTNQDFIDATAIFGAIKKNLITKNFKGGDLTSIFGGVELNLGQADISGTAAIDLTHIFGGAKIVVPSDWTLKTDDLVCIFGGLDDKRKNLGPADPNKVLVLHGTCIFGGIDIKSY